MQPRPKFAVDGPISRFRLVSPRRCHFPTCGSAKSYSLRTQRFYEKGPSTAIFGHRDVSEAHSRQLSFPLRGAALSKFVQFGIAEKYATGIFMKLNVKLYAFAVLRVLLRAVLSPGIAAAGRCRALPPPHPRRERCPDHRVDRAPVSIKAPRLATDRRPCATALPPCDRRRTRRGSPRRSWAARGG